MSEPEKWSLEQNFETIGKRSTLDLTEEVAPNLLPHTLDKPIGRRMRDAMERMKPKRQGA